MGKRESNKGKRAVKGFETAPPGDTSEENDHLTPSSLTRSHEVPVGSWVDVPAGMAVAPGTWVDEQGYLRIAGSNGYAAWCLKDCEKRRFNKDEVIQDVNGVQWCVHCYEKKEQDRELEKIRKLFGSN